MNSNDSSWIIITWHYVTFLPPYFDGDRESTSLVRQNNSENQQKSKWNNTMLILLNLKESTWQKKQLLTKSGTATWANTITIRVENSTCIFENSVYQVTTALSLHHSCTFTHYRTSELHIRDNASAFVFSLPFLYSILNWCSCSIKLHRNNLRFLLHVV